MAKVIRVYGRADSYDIEFSPNGDKWEVDIPPDMTDGVYACQLTAIDENGNFGYWVGELYMCSGVCHFKIRELPYRIEVRHREYGVCFTKGRCRSRISCTPYEMETGTRYISVIKSRKINTCYEILTKPNLTSSVYCLIRNMSIGTGKSCSASVKTVCSEIYTKHKIQTGKECRCDVRS